MASNRNSRTLKHITKDNKEDKYKKKTKQTEEYLNNSLEK